MQHACIGGTRIASTARASLGVGPRGSAAVRGSSTLPSQRRAEKELKMTTSAKNLVSLGSLGSILALAPLAAAAMDFSFRSFDFGQTSSIPLLKEVPTSKGVTPSLLMSGEIRRGDASRLRQFLADHAMEYLQSSEVVLDSQGGDMEESIQLAQVLREVLAQVWAFPPHRCASACFFLYVGAAKRMAFSSPRAGLAIHRPFFSTDVTRRMSAAESDAAHNAGFTRARHWLQDQLVPQVLIDRLFSLPSSQAYWLSNSDIETLGRRSAWYEEWLLARCPDFVRVEQQLFQTRGGPTAARDAAFRNYQPQVKCEIDAQMRDQVATFQRFSATNQRRK